MLVPCCTWNVCSASHKKHTLTYNSAACTWWPYIENSVTTAPYVHVHVYATFCEWFVVIITVYCISRYYRLYSVMLTRTWPSMPRPGPRTWPSRPRPGPRTQASSPRTGPRTAIWSLRTTKDQGQGQHHRLYLLCQLCLDRGLMPLRYLS